MWTENDTRWTRKHNFHVPYPINLLWSSIFFLFLDDWFLTRSFIRDIPVGDVLWWSLLEKRDRKEDSFISLHELNFFGVSVNVRVRESTHLFSVVRRVSTPTLLLQQESLVGFLQVSVQVLVERRKNERAMLVGEGS